jgi:sensor domain CHASE-containing protein
MNFVNRNPGMAVVAGILIVLGLVSAWRSQLRNDQRNTKETNERIEREVKSSIDSATKDIKLCPLSDLDCNRR